MKTKQKIGKHYVNSVSKTVSKARKASPAKGTNPLLKAMIVSDNETLTENGAKTYKSTLNHVLDLFAMGAALRSRSDSDVISLFSKAFAENQLLALKCLFDIRNIRSGKGERKTFRTILKWLGDNYPLTVAKNFSNIAEFGRYDDFLVLLNTNVWNSASDYLLNSLNQDIENYREDKPISLLAKWLPSISTSSKETVKQAYTLAKAWGWTPKQYRKTLSALREYLNVIERNMSANEWTKIDFEKVPSRASMIYRKAFFKHEQVRYQKYLNAVEKGEAKINSGVLFPYDLVDKVLNGQSDQTLDLQWKNLPDYLKGNPRNMLAVCDVSGSMSGLPMSISISLGIYIAERNNGAFKNYFITYSEEPKLQKVIGNTLTQKVRNLQQHCAYSTNLQAVFTNLLDHAVKNKVSEKDMPEQILVITDVEFNHPQNGGTNLESLQAKYKKAGYKVPQLVFWNVNSRKNNVPATADEKGVLLISGASPTVFNTLLSGKQYTPVDQMLETLNQDIYDSVVV